MVREVNALCDAHEVSQEEAQETLTLLKKMNNVLGFLTFSKSQEEEIPKELQDALIKRNEARKQKNWATADKLRDEILERGYSIEDTPAGARLKKG